MGLFNSSDEIKRGDRVRISYTGIEGIVAEVTSLGYLISYQNEKDEEVVTEYMKEDVEKI